MKIEVDQSGKLERTSVPTAISISNNRSFSVYISSTEKKIVQRHFRRIGKPKLYAVLTFSILVAKCLSLLKEDSLGEVIIDREYSGYEIFVCEQVRFFCSLRKIKIDSIGTNEIGRKSNAHKVAIASYRNRKEAVKLKAKDIIEELKNQKPRNA